MEWYIVQDGKKDNKKLFLGDPKKTDYRWTLFISHARSFNVRVNALSVKSSLKYNNPRVVDKNEAKKIERQNIIILDNIKERNERPLDKSTKQLIRSLFKPIKDKLHEKESKDN